MSKTVLDIDVDFILIGISCHVKDYRLNWAINKVLQIDLHKKEDIELFDSKSKAKGVFPFFDYMDKLLHIGYQVVANRSEVNYLVPEQKQIDYFMLLDGSTDLLDINNILSKIRTIDIVLTAFQIDPNQLKSKNNLLF